MVTKPTPGATGWNVAVDEVIDIANSVADLPTRVAALEGAGGDVTEAELAAGLATKAAAVHNHAEFITQDNGDNRYILQTVADTFAPADATTTALAGKVAKSANLSDLGSAAAARTNLGLAALAASGKLADATDVTTTGAAVGQLVAVSALTGGAASGFKLAPANPIGSSRHARGLITKLALGQDPAGVLAHGDSTTGTVSGTTALTYWYYLAMSWLWAKFPAYSVSYLTWDNATQAYILPTKVRTGTAGDRYLRTLQQNAYLTTPDSVATSIAGDMDVQVKCALASWTPATQSALCSKQGGAGQRSWRLELGTNGRPVFSNTTDGTTLIDRTATAAVPFTAGQTGWLRATLDVDNGASGNTVTFYTSTDGATWTQLGTPVITAGTTSVFDSTEPTYFPGRTSGGYNDSAANNATFYELRVLNGIGGTPVIVCDLDAMPLIGTTFTDYTGNAWTLTNPGSGNEQRGGAPGLAVYNGAMSGQVIGYANDSTRAPKLTPYPCDLAFINYGENEGSSSVAYRAAYKQLADFLIAKWPDCRIVATLQPPQLPPADAIAARAHDVRTGQIAALATTADYGIVDVRAAYLPDPSAWLQADGIHPTIPAGGQRWADEVTARHFAPWLALYGLA